MSKKGLDRPTFQEWDLGINVNELNPDFLGRAGGGLSEERRRTLRGDPGSTCDGCGREYFVDLNLPAGTWERVKEQHEEKLCGVCIMNRLEGFREHAYLNVREATPIGGNDRFKDQKEDL